MQLNLCADNETKVQVFMIFIQQISLHQSLPDAKFSSKSSNAFVFVLLITRMPTCLIFVNLNEIQPVNAFAEPKSTFLEKV